MHEDRGSWHGQGQESHSVQEEEKHHAVRDRKVVA